MDEEIKHHRRELERAMSKKDAKRTLELLRVLDNIPMTLDVLVSTQIGATVNKARKMDFDTEATELVSLGRKLVKRWKGQLKDRQDNNRVDINSSNNNNNFSASESSQIVDKSGNNVANMASNISSSGPNNLNGNYSNTNSTASNSNSNNNSSFKQAQDPTSNSTSGDNGQESMQTEPRPSTSSSADSSVPKARVPHPVQTEVPHTNDSVRLTIRKQLTEALKVKLPDELTQEPFLEEEVLAARIEDCIFREFRNSNDNKYRNRCRSRVSNLRDIKNPYLRFNVLRGDILPERIAKMTAEEMASDELKKQREKFTKEAILDHQMALTQGAQSSEIKCPACKKYNCTYNQMQTRSADEPMTTFCHCNDCGKRWKFC